MTRRRLALLALLLLACAAPPSAAAATDETLLRRHAPVLVLDAREPGPPVAVEPFLRGARGATSRTPRTRPIRVARRMTARGRTPTTRHAATAGGCARRWW